MWACRLYGSLHTDTQTPHRGQSRSCLSLHSPLRHYWRLELIPQQWGCARPCVACACFHVCVSTCMFTCFCVKVRGWGDWLVLLKMSLRSRLPSLFIYFSLFAYNSVDTPTAGILHTHTRRHNRSRVGSRGMGPPRAGPPPGPNQYMRSHASITESLLSQGLGGYNRRYSCVCVWERVCVCVCALTPVVSILLVSFCKSRLSLTFFDIISVKRRLSVCIFIAGSVASSAAFSHTELNTTQVPSVKPVQYCRFSARNDKQSLPEPVSNKTLYFSH